MNLTATGGGMVRNGPPLDERGRIPGGTYILSWTRGLMGVFRWDLGLEAVVVGTTTSLFLPQDTALGVIAATPTGG
jgi:hypothetical protein